MKCGHELHSALRQFWGSETLYQHPFNRRVVYTEGMKFFFDNAGNGAYWLLDILITQPEILKPMRELGIVFVRLKVTGSHAMLTVNADDGEPALYEREIHITDCPECPKTEHNPNAEWMFYFENSTLMLPSER
jgi:hypothetical protein